MKIKFVGQLFFAACLCVFGGCIELKMSATTPWSKTPPEAKPDDVKTAEVKATDKEEKESPEEEPLPPPSVPNRLSVVWTDTVLHQHQRPAIRGFGGRIIFYADKPEDDDAPAEPVIVDGTLTVYAFGDDHGKGIANKPEKRFVFLPEQLEKHRSKSDIGHSYSVWLPWDEVGGPQRRISLFVRFEPSQGGAVMSDAAPKILPGAPPESQIATTTAAKPALQDTSIEQAVAEMDVDRELSRSERPSETLGMRLQNSIAERRQELHGIQQAAYQSDPALAAPVKAKEKMSTVTIDVPSGFVQQTLTSPLTTEQVEQAAFLDAVRNGQQPPLAETSSAPTEATAEKSRPSQVQEEAAEPSTRYSRSGRFVRDRFRVRKWQEEQQADDPIRRQPLPATWPSDLRPTPQSPPVSEMNLIPQVDAQ